MYYFDEAAQEDEVDDLQQNVEERTSNRNDEDELTVSAKERELAKLEEFQVYEVVPEEQSYGKKRITTRWEMVHRSDAVLASLVAREHKRSEYMDDVCAPNSGHSTSRIVDYVALTGDIE